ncbi:tryptophan 2,3-dioxygenase family protein [Streptomyces mangrovisoli]|uniref:Tryptophan 2,3-dioxygenase n=1 Tax=Streptomyces mangrovisoli TaxID=1428628 RepID=A0A1J4NNB7_9ACTN|nr:tryptophan 2,3-dioxygenase family protein [Streptomyces mangrovisoli]OIJ63634.1 tryptophan 2,3-dioxygenase [Streptomyces mangrovisoli]
MRDYSEQILDGEGKDDYARYMCTDALLSLQRRPEEVVHRDELLFQVVHQSTELWLKLAGSELGEAAARIRAGETDAACALLRRASLGVELVTGQLEMMRHLSPWDFQTIRTVLGHGSGADSPGWRSVQRCGRLLDSAFTTLIAERGIDLADLYRERQGSPEHRLAEALVEWDERVSLWRVRHYKVTTRIIGTQVVGTQGTPVDVLARLIEYKFFPRLWAVRTELTRTGPMGNYHEAESA